MPRASKSSLPKCALSLSPATVSTRNGTIPSHPEPNLAQLFWSESQARPLVHGTDQKVQSATHAGAQEPAWRIPPVHVLRRPARQLLRLLEFQHELIDWPGRAVDVEVAR